MDMSRVNKLKEMLGRGKTAIGPFMKLSSPAVVEILGNYQSCGACECYTDSQGF